MIRAVVCDDEPVTQQMISYCIKAEGFPIEIVGTATDGESSITLIQKEQPDIIFLDIHLPLKNGFEVIKQLKNTYAKILIVTGYSTFSNAQTALRLGASDIIEKPIDIEQLREVILRSTGCNFTTNDSLNRALLYIHQNYTKKILLDDLANTAYCTKSHIAHLFQQHFQISALSYINELRIRKSIQMFKDGHSIQETAYSVGYSSLNNFYKYFKKQTGKTPAEFQRDIRLKT